MPGDAGSGTSTRSRTGSGARAARPDRAASRPRSLSTAGWRPRMNSRSSVRASTASSCAAAMAWRTGSGSDSNRSRAMPRFMASDTSRCCAPSCRSRSIRRRSASAAATRSARLRASDSTRWARLSRRPGPSSARARPSSALVTRAASPGTTGNRGTSTMPATPVTTASRWYPSWCPVRPRGRTGAGISAPSVARSRDRCMALSPCTSHGVSAVISTTIPTYTATCSQLFTPVASVNTVTPQITMSAPSRTPPARPASRPARALLIARQVMWSRYKGLRAGHYGALLPDGWGFPQAGQAGRPNYRKPPVRHRGCHDRDPRTDQAVRAHHRRLGPDVHRPARHGHRLPRAERRREVHHDAHDPRPGRADQRLGHGQRPAAAGARRAAARGRRHAGPAGGAPVPQRLPPPARARPDHRHPPVPGGRGDRRGRAALGGGPAGRQVLPRHGAAARHRRRAARRPGHRGAGRAGERAGRRGHPVDARDAGRTSGPGQDGLRLLAPDERDRADRHAPDRHRHGPSDRRHQRDRVHRRARVAGRRLRRPDQGRGGVPRGYFRGGEMSTLRVTQARVMKSEWTKLRTQPGALWSLLSAVILVVAFGILYSLLRVARPPHGAAVATFDPTSISLAGVQLAQIAAGVLGVLLITSEYATGLVRTTLAAVPRRLPTLWGKAAVVTGAVVAVSVPAAVAVFLAGQAILGRQHLSVSFGDPGVARAVLGSTLYLAVAGLLGLALGALLRSTAGGIATLFGLLFAVPILVGFLPGSLADEIGKYLPGTAGLAVTTVHPDPATSLGPWTGFGVFCAYALLLLGAAAVRMRRGDA